VRKHVWSSLKPPSPLCQRVSAELTPLTINVGLCGRNENCKRKGEASSLILHASQPLHQTTDREAICDAKPDECVYTSVCMHAAQCVHLSVCTPQ